MVLTGILCMIGSAAFNLLIVGFYIGRYKGDLEDCSEKVHDLEDEKKQERKDDVGIRERLRYLEAKINGKMWKLGE